MKWLLDCVRHVLLVIRRLACLLYWNSPLPRWFMGDTTADDITAGLIRCRQDIEARRGSPRFQPEWEHALVQLEWEHVRRLECAGRHGDPFVRMVKARAQRRVS